MMIILMIIRCYHEKEERIIIMTYKVYFVFERSPDTHWESPTKQLVLKVLKIISMVNNVFIVIITQIKNWKAVDDNTFRWERTSMNRDI